MFTLAILGSEDSAEIIASAGFTVTPTVSRLPIAISIVPVLLSVIVGVVGSAANATGAKDITSAKVSSAASQRRD